MRWIDTHNHLDAAEFDRDRDAVVARTREVGVQVVVIPSVAASNFDCVRETAWRYGDAYALGIHPMAVPHAKDEHLEQLRQAVAQHRHDPRLVAVGEIGIDGFVPTCATPEMLRRQQAFLLAQLRIARDFGLPVLLHVRKGVDQVLAGLRRIDVPGGIAHAFNGSEAQAAVFINMGLKLGFGGALTFERALHLRRLAKSVPLSAIVMETDSPDIPPTWLYRPRADREVGATMRNEASELPRIAQTIADLRVMSLSELAASTTHNACAVLPKLSSLLLQPLVEREKSGS